jgi:hypothetical protein
MLGRFTGGRQLGASPLGSAKRSDVVAQGTRLDFGVPVALVATLWVAGSAYQEYWLRGAERAVVSAAEALARGAEVPRLKLHEFAHAPDLAGAFGSGFRVSGFDNIGLGFHASYVDGAWQLSCCTQWSEADLP